jgi:hypothetical protein
VDAQAEVAGVDLDHLQQAVGGVTHLLAVTATDCPERRGPVDEREQLAAIPFASAAASARSARTTPGVDQTVASGDYSKDGAAQPSPRGERYEDSFIAPEASM